MSTSISRRKFMAALGLTAGAAAALPFSATASPLSILDTQKAKIKFGSSAITWGGKDIEAIKEIAATGYKGIQLRANTFKDYGDKPEVIRELLQAHKLELAMFSSGNVNINPIKGKDDMAMHLRHAKFVKALGGKYLQLTSSGRPDGGGLFPAEDLKRLGKLMTEIGKRTADMGIKVAYHNHMHHLGESPQEIETIMAATNPKYVKFLLDIAHYFQGGGDPAKAVTQYKDTLVLLHLKDVVRPLAKPPVDPSRNYIFVELGEGLVDIPAVMKALEAINFKGYGLVELDSVPIEGRTPLQSAKMSKAYIEQVLKYKI